METRIFVSDTTPVTANSKLIGDNVWLEFTQGADTMALCMPKRMEAASRMIAEAFNAHMMGGPITKKAQGEVAKWVDGGIIREFRGGDVGHIDPRQIDEVGRKIAAAKAAFPTGGSLSAEDALAAMKTNMGPALSRLAFPKDGPDDAFLSRFNVTVVDTIKTDEDAAHAIERRDLP